MKLKDLFFFDEMLAPKIITFSYWMLLLSTFINLGTLFYVSFSIRVLMIHLFSLLSSILLVRLGCELVVVLFRIHQGIQKLVEKETH